MQAPRHAMFSGYSMSSEYFMELALTLRPHFETYARQNQPLFALYVCEYDSWRRALPTEDRAKAPLLKGAVPPEVSNTCTLLTPSSAVLRTEANNQKDDGDESETKLFFPTRWTPAEEPDHHAQLQDSALKQETESDRAHRDELIELIKRTSGFSVDKSRLQFECVKDVHPFRDPLRTI
ncbi:hypothetical protein B0H10DRAFT_1973394 [Mycena sp. CBHHK59/15]|nr:hypothetical protein B0H10DRAFT_1973503 [Mycena sp. CBHHK59/15]KAJ6531452.1 hypothetical protein B0H10DRAFT_1973394 [Mycena sp. CBHHK59/15]